MKPIFYTLAFLLFASCGPGSDGPYNIGGKPSDHQVDSMKQVVKDLERQLREQEAGDKEAKDLSALKSRASEIKTSEQPPPAPVPEKKSAKTKGSTLYYFTGTKKIAVEITPWKNNRRRVIFYDRKGVETYVIGDVQLSYSETTSLLSFHPGGAANAVEHVSNPGGSRYIPRTMYWFDEENHPLRSEYDSDRDEDQLMPPAEYKRTWDRTTRSWKMV